MAKRGGKEHSDGKKLVVQNRKARHDYEIIDVIESGIVLTGTEVKSLRAGRANLKDSYATVDRGEIYLHRTHISAYEAGTHYNHSPERTRKLLLNRREIRRLIGRTQQGGLTMVPLSIYFIRGRAKVELALAKGKKEYDKRHAIAERQAARDVERALKDRSQ
ncbi:MAG: SsrA-binding protein SmpB [Candidatus Latescibacterota bacterium]|nr:SsrA-binding protein SmpB [Candidatus Latescibacterota bacterium]